MLIVSGAGSLGHVQMRNSSDSAFLLYAPNAPVALSNSAVIFGAVVGNTVTLENSQTLRWSGPQAAPPPLTCP
jgi:hypothetical protein